MSTRLLARLCISTLLLVAGLGTSGAWAQSFGSCDSRMWIAQDNPTTLYDIDTSTNPFTFPAIGDAGVPYNSIAFNPADNYIYAIRNDNQALIRINNDGSFGGFGSFGLPDQFYRAGEIAGDGFYYIWSAGSPSTIYRVDISNLPLVTFETINLSRSIDIADLAWSNGMLYAAEGGPGPLISIDVVGVPAGGTAAVTTIGATGIASINVGAMFGAPNGVFGSANNGDGFYQFDLTTGDATLISDSPGSTNNDGAHCINAEIGFDADLSVTKTDNSLTYTPGTDVVYDIVVTNNGPFGVQNATVEDALPAGITTASWTCVGAGGGVCGTASGSGGISDTPDLPVGTTITYTYTVTIPPDYSGELINTVTVDVPAGFNDPTPGDNTATDTDQRVPSITITKISTNGVDTFSFTGTNGFEPQDITTTTEGVPVSGTTQFLDAPDTETTITESIPSAYELTDITCSGLGAGGTFTTDLNAGTVTLDAAATPVNTDIECTFTNDRLNTDLAVTKSASPDPVLTGDVLTYTIVGENLGPRDAANSLLTDTPDPNLDCSTPSTTITCVASGGATCPSDPIPVADLTGPGITIPFLPVGGQVEFTMQCTVNATGL